jgi:hypothetical protein
MDFHHAKEYFPFDRKKIADAAARGKKGGYQENENDKSPLFHAGQAPFLSRI